MTPATEVMITAPIRMRMKFRWIPSEPRDAVHEHVDVALKKKPDPNQPTV